MEHEMVRQDLDRQPSFEQQVELQCFIACTVAAAFRDDL
jgi:hypothetical protein